MRGKKLNNNNNTLTERNAFVNLHLHTPGDPQRVQLRNDTTTVTTTTTTTATPSRWGIADTYVKVLIDENLERPKHL